MNAKRNKNRKKGYFFLQSLFQKLITKPVLRCFISCVYVLLLFIYEALSTRCLLLSITLNCLAILELCINMWLTHLQIFIYNSGENSENPSCCFATRLQPVIVAMVTLVCSPSEQMMFWSSGCKWNRGIQETGCPINAWRMLASRRWQIDMFKAKSCRSGHTRGTASAAPSLTWLSYNGGFLKGMKVYLRYMTLKRACCRK